MVEFENTKFYNHTQRNRGLFRMSMRTKTW